MDETREPIWLERVACAFCGQDNVQVLFRIEEEKILSRSAAQIPQHSEKYATIVKCKNCALVYANPRWIFPKGAMPYSEESEDQYFASTYHVRQVAFTKLADQAQLLLPPVSDRRTLDIGCGDGLLMETCLRAGFQCEGLNFGGLSARLCGPEWHQIDPFVHLYYFIGSTLNAMLAKSGLRMVGRFYLASASAIKEAVQRVFDRLHIAMDNGLGVIGQRVGE
jgi:hypothetical protein